ncbi:MFS transporter [Hyphobacterium sp. HN65]|uniref:MFS transporter n=1 Tax=Hyphobacterium lacteum TaxID=3116575 RepID=A0ABU7LLI5_9PROT|nr:MFS transporter [Hyphobacterium sp. HN65]MEE2524795.1 MFS transporter [Hyphobacterium sp. HN65]
MSAKIAINLVGQRRYWPMLVAQSLGAFNDNFFRYALVTIVAFQGVTLFGLNSEMLVPIAASAFTLPIFLFSAFAGRLADKVDRTRIMRFAKFAEIWLMLIVACGFMLREPLLLIVALFFMGVQSAFFAPAKNSALPTLLEPHELVPGNAMISGLLNISVLIGIGFGTVLITRENGPLIVGSVLVGVAVIGWIAMRQLPPAPASNPEMKLSYNFIWEIVRVLRSAFENPQVLRPLLGAAWFWMLAASIVTLIPNFARGVLGTDETAVLLFSALFTIGAAIGAILCGALSGKGDALPFSVAGAIGLVIFNVDVAMITWNNPPVPADAELIPGMQFVQDPANRRLLIDLVLAAVSAGLFVVPLQAMAQRRAPESIRGRLLAAGGLMNAFTATLGQFTLAAIAFVALPLQTAFLYIAGVSAIVAIVAFIRMMKLRGQSPSPS